MNNQVLKRFLELEDALLWSIFREIIYEVQAVLKLVTIACFHR